MTIREATRLTFDKPGRGRVYESILETIGNTPLVRVGKLAAEMGCKAEVLAKLDFFNPVGSVKDRIAVSMLEAMEADGTIGPGSVIVEPTSGNTGIALAVVCAAKGYRCILTMPDSFSIERRKLMKFMGAERDAGISRRWLHDNAARSNRAIGFHSLHHRNRNAVLDTADRIEEIQFSQNFGLAAHFGRQLVNAN